MSTSYSNPAEYDQVVGAIYEGAAESPPWRSTATAFQNHFAADRVTIELGGTSSGFVRPLLEDSGSDAAADIPSFDLFRELPPGQLFSGRELCAGGGEDTLDALGVADILGSDFYAEDGQPCSLRILRYPRRPGFSADEKARCRLLMPHLHRAVKLHAHMDTLECERRLSAQAVERLLLGMIIFGAHGQLLKMNLEARQILAERDGIRLVNGRLFAAVAAEQLELQKLVRQSLESAHDVGRPGLVRAMLISRTPPRAKLSVAVRRVEAASPGAGGQRPAAVLYLRDPEHAATASIDTLMRLFGMTRAQAGLASLLMRGLSVEEAAEQLQVSRNTLRSHLRELHAKVGVSRRTELLRILIGSGAALA